MSRLAQPAPDAHASDPDLFTEARPSRSTLTASIAAYFRARPYQWIDGRLLMTIGGGYAWRSRISDCRRPPYAMRLLNRQQRVTRPDGSNYVVSEYRYVPAEAR